MSNGRISHPELWTAEKIIELIREGNLPPWAKSWSISPDSAPRNLLNPKIPYRGLNYMLLSMVAGIHGSPFFITPKQLFTLGGKKKDDTQHTWPVFFFTKVKFVKKDAKEDDEDDREVFICKGYKVYNINQTVGIPAEKIPDIAQAVTYEHDPIETCERIVAGYEGPSITHGGDSACYFPDEDRIYMPLPARFETREQYYSTRFHEMVHSTGHRSRLAREFGKNFGNHKYSKEELVAEFGAAMLCGRAGIAQKTIENSAAYIKGWGKKLDPEMLVIGSREARKAYQCITGEVAVEGLKEEAAA